MSTLQQIKALQAQLELETKFAELLQTDNDLAELLINHKNRIYPYNKPLYTAIGSVTFKATEQLLNDIKVLFDKAINTLSGSGFWRYTSVPNTEAAKLGILKDDSKTEFRRNTKCMRESTISGTKVSFYVLIQDKPVEINIDYYHNDRAFIVPYLQKNHSYKADGSRGKQYKGINGANDSDSCINSYAWGCFDDMLPKLSNNNGGK